ncbi:MAG: hypothetical protein QOD77_1521 [Thermoplasmata archaeon]|nr:hypothetical protein [Thermoplasmata archaeon]
MGVVGDLLHWLTETAQAVLAATGLWGVFLLMAAESMVFPVPSEAVMPFAGLAAARGEMSVLGVLLASTAGSLLGSWLGYLMGKHGLLPLVERYGRYVFVQPHHVAKAHAFFARRGVWAVFLCRFIPGVRHVSSMPAGAARMPLGPFLAATAVGATIWNMFLFWLGYRYGQAAIDAAKPYLDLVGVVLLVLLVAYVVYEVRKGRKARKAAALDGH